MANQIASDDQMFFVLCKRTVDMVKVSQQVFPDMPLWWHGAWTVSGPFTLRQRAEQAAVATLGTPTCLSAMIYSWAELEFAARSDSTDEGPRDVIRHALFRIKAVRTQAKAAATRQRRKTLEKPDG